jgi:hypothetical protein
MYKLVYGDDAALSAMFAQAVALKINLSKLLQVMTDFAMILPYANIIYSIPTMRPYSANMPLAFHVMAILPPFGVTGKPVTEVSMYATSGEVDGVPVSM